MISIKQIRAARGLLNWTQKDIADKTSLSREAVKNIENGISSPRRETLAVIQKAFEDYGVEFLAADGVRMRDATVHVLYGESGITGLFDDIYETVVSSGKKEILIAK
jgi:transcriptional regulator with XRE-family HTH domain